MIRGIPLFNFALLLVLSAASSACQRRPTPAINEPNPSHFAKILSVSPLDGPQDPRWLWIETVTKSSLSELPFLRTSCEGTRLRLEAREGELPCAALGEIFTSPFVWTCDSPQVGWLQHPQLRCEETRLLSPALPAKLGLYIFEAPSLKPNPLWKNLSTDLPEFSWAPHQEPDLVSPDWKTWLASSFNAQGPLEVRLSYRGSSESENARVLYDLKTFLERSKSSALFQLDLIFEGPANWLPPKRDLVRLPWVEFESEYSSGLLAESCQFFEKWIRSRQTLSPTRHSSTEKLKLRCEIKGSSDAASYDAATAGPRLVLTRLALPLMFRQSRTFLFQSREDLSRIPLYKKAANL